MIVSLLGTALVVSCTEDPFTPPVVYTPPPVEPAVLGPDVDGPIVIARSEDPDTETDTEGDSDSDTEDPPVEITLALCETEAGYSVSTAEGTPVLDDFEDGDDAVFGNGRVGTWYTYGDEFGTLTPGSEPLEAPGQGGSGFALHASGVGFTEWGSGMGTGLAFDSGGSCVHDLSVYTGLSFWARGQVTTLHPENVEARDFGAFKVLLTEAEVTPVEEGGGCDEKSGSCWDSHRVRFQPTECWNLYSFPFSDFAQDGWGQDGGDLNLDQIYNMNFETAAHNDWELWVDDIQFYVGDPPSAPEDCNIPLGEGGANGLP